MARWLITGISSGIGAALAAMVLERGESVVGTARDAAAAGAFGARAPARAQGIALDIARHDEVPAAIDAAFAGGPIDVVVNNVGQSLYGAIEEVTVEEARRLFDVNVFGTWAVTRAALPHLRAQGRGTIVTLSSGCGIMGMAGLGAYCASKFALEGMHEALAQEAGMFGLKVMLVEPGAIATRFISHNTNEAALRLPEYAAISGNGKAALDGFYETSAAPPESVAAAILDAIDTGEPPLRLPVGEDMRGLLAAKAGQMSAAAG